MRNRARLGFVGLVLCFVIAAFGLGAGSASGAETSTGEKCSPGKAICLTVKTFEGITASEPGVADGTRYTYVEWTVRNDGASTLTQVKATATTSLSTATFVTALPPGCTGGGTTSITCKYSNLPAGTGAASSATTRAYFKTGNAPATSNNILVTASAKEGVKDKNECPAGGTDPNCETIAWDVTNSYEPDADAALTFALNGNRFRLPTNDGKSSFTFTAPSVSPFLTTFTKLTAADATALCFSTVVCFDRPLSVTSGGNLSFGQSTPVLFYSRLENTNIPPNQLNAIHFYDAVGLVAANNRLTQTAAGPSFERMDGLRLTAAAFGLEPGKYFVVNYQAKQGSTPESFQLSLEEDGTPLALTPGSGSGEPIRIIGDDKDGSERSSEVCSTSIPPSSVAMPKVCAMRAGPQTLDAFLWDTGNGNVNW